jgi:hypothetical protein
MDMCVKTTRSYNIVLPSNHVCTRSYHHVGVDAVHDIWVACFPDTDDMAIFDSNIGLEDAGPINYEGVCNDGVQTFGVRASSCLSHALSECFAASERAFVSIRGHIFLHLDPEVCSAQAYAIARRGAEHGNVSLALHGEGVDVCSVAQRLRFMKEAASLESLHDTTRDSCILDVTRRNPVTTLDDLVTANLYQSDRFGVAGFEADRRAGGNVEPVAMRAYAIEL